MQALFLTDIDNYHKWWKKTAIVWSKGILKTIVFLFLGVGVLKRVGAPNMEILEDQIVVPAVSQKVEAAVSQKVEAAVSQKVGAAVSQKSGGIFIRCWKFWK